MFKYDDFESLETPKTVKQLFIFMVKPYIGKSVLFFVLTLLGITAWSASPAVVAEAVNKLSSNHHLTSFVWWLIALYFILRFIDEAFWRLGELLMISYKPEMIERIRSVLFAASLRKSYSYSVNSSSGQIGYWINQTTRTVNEFVDTTIWSVWGRTTGLIISAAFLFIVHWSLGVVFVVWLVLLFWFNIIRGKKFANMVAAQTEEESKASGIVVDVLSNHLSVRTYNAQEREKQTLYAQQKHIVRRWTDSWRQNLITNVAKGQSAALVSGVAFMMVIILYAHGVIPIGGILLFAAYFGDASSSLWELAWSLDSYYRNSGSIRNALDGLNGEDARTGEIVKRSDMPAMVSLTLKDLSFSYPDQSTGDVIDSINLEVPSGAKIGIVGHSGAGKSTLVGLLLGFYEPTSGQILINGVDITTKDPSFSRAVSSFVPQDTSLFNRSVKENVVYANPKASDKELQSALVQSKTVEFIDKLPNGVDTLIGERGVKLSGGQRQRIAIARAILKNAPLLILDEATSALDSVSEQAIQKALHELMKKRTTIVIAHRLSTLRHLDRIVVLDKGRIVEQGTHDQLVKADGIYADLWKRQKDGFIVD